MQMTKKVMDQFDFVEVRNQIIGMYGKEVENSKFMDDLHAEVWQLLIKGASLTSTFLGILLIGFHVGQLAKEKEQDESVGSKT